MKIYCYPLLALAMFTMLFAEKNPYLDVANELLVRKKLSKKLPDVFQESKFLELADKLDNIENIEQERRTHIRRLQSSSIEYHWCFASAYLLSNNFGRSQDHYRRYKILSLGEAIKSTNQIFQREIEELEINVETQQANLANEINYYIQILKNNGEFLNMPQVKDLQTKLNIYNELNGSNTILTVDGIIGNLTKATIYDFEENNPYIYNQKTNLSSTESKEISSPRNILPVALTANDLVKNALTQTVKLNTKFTIDAEKIKTMPGSTIAEILEYALGVNVKRQGMSDVLSNISTFGGTGEQTLILIDGVRISNQQSLNHDLDIPLNIQDIKQIEIYRNSAGRMYGNGAVSGLVNIITKSGKDRDTYISTHLGNFGYLDGNLAISLPIGKSFHSISYSYLQSSKFLDHHTDDQINFKKNLYYKYSLKDNKTFTNFSFGYLNRGDMVQNRVSYIYKNQYEQNSTKFFNSRIQWDFGKIQLESNTHWHEQLSELAYDKSIGGWKRYTSSEIGANFKSAYDHKYGLTQLGLIYNREMNANTFVTEFNRNHFIINFQHDIASQNWDINLGLSANSNDVGIYTAPGYQFVYHLNRSANIYHKYDYGFRIPSFYELYATDYLYKGAISVGNNLNSEKNHTYEYGIQLYGAPMTMTLSMFYKNSTDIIDWYSESGGIPIWTSTNISDVITSGHNIYLELFPNIVKTFRFINRLEIGYSYINIEHNGKKSYYKYLSNYLKHQSIISANYNLPFGISRSWHIRYEQPSLALYENRTIIDTQIHFKIWRFENALNIKNLLDVMYEDVQDATLPGRTISFDIRFNL